MAPVPIPRLDWLTMCGIAGYLLEAPRPADTGELRMLLESLRPRGPDDEGLALISRSTGRCRHLRTERTAAPLSATLAHFENDSDAFPHDLALVNTRFAVIDTSAGGHQPFTSADGSVTAVFNGEIYNYVELRERLRRSGVTFRTASDTEVLVEGYRIWRDDLWNRLNGFWAVALFDAETGALALSRDRFGIAPLHVREMDGGLWFASTIRPLLDIDRRVSIDGDAVRGFIDTSLKDFDERTFFGPILSLAPREVARFHRGTWRRDRAEVRRYWSFPERCWTERDLTTDEAARRFRDLLFDAVQLRLRTDLRLAFELSGGLDSSSIVAAAAAQGARITTYTLEVEGRNEEPFARQLAARFGLDYRVIRDVPGEIPERLPDFVRLMEEPWHAPNVYTHYALRRAMKEDGTHVVLAGSAGDELLAGYDVDFWPRARQELRRSGKRTSALLGELFIRFQTAARARDAARDLLTWIPRRLHAEGQPAGDRPYAEPGSSGRETAASRLRASWPALSFQDQRVFHIQRARLPYYLRTDDRYSMTLPLEHRLPFLDYRLVEFSLQLPASHLIHNGWTKYVLRKAMEPFLPRAVTWRRRKMGFPFALRPFLREQRERLAPLVRTVREVGIVDEDESAYPALCAAAPYRLWRICSTGAWLEATGAGLSVVG